MGRTESQKVLQAPIVVVLGGKEHEIKLLVLRDSRVWRTKVVKVLASLPQFFGATSAEPEQFEKALQTLLVTNADTVLDLFFDYAKDLNRDEIEAIATDKELAKAWEQITEAAFPLAQSLLGMMTKLSP